MTNATIRELLPPESPRAFDAMRALRPQLRDASEFVALVDESLRATGYRLIGVFEPEAEDAAAVAGFRVTQSICWGRFLYVDDFSTLPAARRRGHGRRLMDWLLAEAGRQGCGQLHLD